MCHIGFKKDSSNVSNLFSYVKSVSHVSKYIYSCVPNVSKTILKVFLWIFDKTNLHQFVRNNLFRIFFKSNSCQYVRINAQ